MPSWLASGGFDQGAADIGVYAQANFPVDCLTDAHCDDANVCTDDLCDGQFCQNTPNVDPCDDGLSCTAGDTCSAGVCSGVDNCPVGEFCNANTGVCELLDPDNDGLDFGRSPCCDKKRITPG